MSNIKPISFTDEDALEFRAAMRDIEKWKDLYDKVELRNQLIHGDNYGNKPPVNEQGFTNEEVDFLKETFPENEKGGSRRRYRKKRSQRRSTKRHTRRTKHRQTKHRQTKHRRR